MTVYVGNIHYTLDELGIKAMFSQVAIVKHVTLIKEKKTGRSKGYAFVKFIDEANAAKALEMNGQEINKRRLIVMSAHTRSEKHEQKGKKTSTES